MEARMLVIMALVYFIAVVDTEEKVHPSQTMSKKLEEKVSSLQKELQLKTKQEAELRKKISELNEHVLSLQKDMIKESKEKERFQRQAEEMKRALSNKEESTKRTIDQLKKKIVDFEQMKVESSSDSVERLKKMVKELREQKASEPSRVDAMAWLQQWGADLAVYVSNAYGYGVANGPKLYSAGCEKFSTLSSKLQPHVIGSIQAVKKTYDDHFSVHVDPVVRKLTDAIQPHAEKYAPIIREQSAFLKAKVPVVLEYMREQLIYLRKKLVYQVKRIDKLAPYSDSLVNILLGLFLVPFVFLIVTTLFRIVFNIVRLVICDILLCGCCCRRKKFDSRSRKAKKAGGIPTKKYGRKVKKN